MNGSSLGCRLLLTVHVNLWNMQVSTTYLYTLYDICLALSNRSVVTRVHNARSYDVDHVCMKSKPVDVNVPAAAFNRCCKHADFTNSNDSKAVVFELFSTKQEKLIEIGLHCMHTGLVFNEAFKKQNPVFR